MKTFRAFVQLHEADTSRASNFESYIKQALNAQLKNTPLENVPPKERDAVRKIANTIINKLKLNPSTPIEFVRAGSNKGPLSEFYRAQGATDGTSKSDLRSTDNKIRFSAKAAGGAMLASGSQADQRAAFYWALNANPDIDTSFQRAGETVLKLVEDYMSPLEPPSGAEKIIDIKHISTVGSRPGVLDAAAKATEYSTQIRAWLQKVKTRDEKMKNEIGEALRVALESNRAFRQYYTFECATGQGKFGDINLVGPWSANYMLVFDYNGRAKVDEITGPYSPIINEYAQNMKFRFRWKHGAKTRVSLDLPGKFLSKELTTESLTFSTLLAREVALFEHQMLTEGVLDTVAQAWTRFKTWFVTTLEKLLAAIRQAFAAGITAVLEFFDITPVNIESSWSVARVN